MFCSQEKIEMATRVASEAVGSSIVFFRKKYITPALDYFMQIIKLKGEKVKMRKEKGITLIALIITIIVMLILVGVVVTVVIQSNLLGTAKTAGDKYKTAYENESNMSEVTINGEKYASIEDYLEGKVELPEIKAGEKATQASKYETAVIPAGFTVSGAGAEKTVDGGLVIYLIDKKEDGTSWTEEEIKAIDWSNEETVADLRTKYDQFVWIPISHTKINDMFICQAKENPSDKCSITVKNGVATCTTHNSTQMAGRLYATRTGENYYKKAYTEVYTPNSGLREPDIVIGSNGTRHDADPTNLEYIATVTGDSTSYASTDEFKKTLQTEYNEIVKSIYNAEGFWVGRYETSNMTKNANTAVKVIDGTNTGISNVNWYYMYGQQKAYSVNKNLGGIKSSMILGACHDQVLEFVNTENYNVKQARNVGHTSSEFTTKPYLTGGIGYSENYSGTIAYNDVSRNVYDLEGNVFEWTTESDSSDDRVFRGRRLHLQQFS